MAKHGGFAAAVQIRQQTLQHLLTLLHRAGQLPTNIAAELPPVQNQTGQGSATLKINWYVPAPRVHLDPAYGGDARVYLRLVGPMQIEAEGTDNLERKVALDLVIEMPLGADIIMTPSGVILIDSFFTVTGPSFNLVVRLTPVETVESVIAVLSGPPLPAAWQTYFSSGEFRSTVAVYLTSQLGNVSIPLPARFTPFLQALQIGFTSTEESVTTVIGDGFATFGVDITNETFDIASSGNSAAVENFLSQSDIAMIIDELTAPLLAEYLKTEAKKQLGGEGEITQLLLTFESEEFKMSGHLEASAGSADFTCTAKPTLGRPEWLEVSDDEYGQITIAHDETDEIWMDVKSLDVDSDLAWWMYLILVAGAAVSVVTGGGGFVIGMAFYLSPLVYQLYNTILMGLQIDFISGVEGQELVSRRQAVTLGGIPVETVITALQVFQDRIQGRLTFTPDPEQLNGRLTGPVSLNVRDLRNTKKYILTPSPMHYDVADPELRVRWQLHRLDTNEIVWVKEFNPGEKGSHSVTLRFTDFGAGSQPINDFKLSVRVYRAIIGEMFDSLNRSLSIHIRDRLDRSHPFIRWQHKVGTPDVEVLPSGEKKRVGMRRFIRKSKLHRTDHRRCLFVEQFTTDITKPEYLDALPFPEDQLFANRTVLCDFCFFGGPDKIMPLPLP